jgi:hypothetical protein
MKIRKGFVSNSSSSSFIVIGKDEYFEGDLLDENKIFHIGNNEGEITFGWGPEIIYCIKSKINFAYLICLYNENETWKEMLFDLIKKETKCNNIQIHLTTYDWGKNEENLKYGSIDHQSVENGVNTEMFYSVENLKNFIFSNNSYIELDNDNN